MDALELECFGDLLEAAELEQLKSLDTHTDSKMDDLEQVLPDIAASELSAYIDADSAPRYDVAEGAMVETPLTEQALTDSEDNSASRSDPSQEPSSASGRKRRAAEEERLKRFGWVKLPQTSQHLDKKTRFVYVQESGIMATSLKQAMGAIRQMTELMVNSSDGEVLSMIDAVESVGRSIRIAV